MNSINKKHIVKKMILNIIKNSGPISRININRMIGIRLATITEVTKELLDEGIILESGDIDSDASKKKLLSLNGNCYHVIGVDIKAYRILSIITNLNGAIIKKAERKIEYNDSKQVIIDNIFDSIDELLSFSGEMKILGIGIANLGIIDKKNERIVLSSQFENWNDVPLKQIIEDRYKYTVFMEDSAILNLQAEKWFGEANGFENVIYVQMGKGFGISIISNDVFIKGYSGIAGELGHTIVKPQGDFCICGNYGCLQTVASSTVIVKKVVDVLKRGAYSLINELTGNEPSKVDINIVLEAAAKGDKIATAVMMEAARYIGTALSNAINLLNPQLVIFGGQMTGENGYIIDLIVQIIKTNTLYLASKDIVYKIAKYDDIGGALGGVAAVLDNFFESTRLKNYGFIAMLDEN